MNPSDPTRIQDHIRVLEGFPTWEGTFNPPTTERIYEATQWAVPILKRHIESQTFAQTVNTPQANVHNLSMFASGQVVPTDLLLCAVKWAAPILDASIAGPEERQSVASWLDRIGQFMSAEAMGRKGGFMEASAMIRAQIPSNSRFSDQERREVVEFLKPDPRDPKMPDATTRMYERAVAMILEPARREPKDSADESILSVAKMASGATAEIKRLADFILEEFPNEPGAVGTSESAVDVAIRLLKATKNPASFPRFAELPPEMSPKNTSEAIVVLRDMKMVMDQSSPAIPCFQGETWSQIRGAIDAILMAEDEGPICKTSPTWKQIEESVAFLRDLLENEISPQCRAGLLMAISSLTSAPFFVMARKEVRDMAERATGQIFEEAVRQQKERADAASQHPTIDEEREILSLLGAQPDDSILEAAKRASEKLSAISKTPADLELIATRLVLFANMALRSQKGDLPPDAMGGQFMVNAMCDAALILRNPRSPVRQYRIPTLDADRIPVTREMALEVLRSFLAVIQRDYPYTPSPLPEQWATLREGLIFVLADKPGKCLDSNCPKTTSPFCSDHDAELRRELAGDESKLRDIRDAIGANPEESTLDEVRRILAMGKATAKDPIQVTPGTDRSRHMWLLRDAANRASNKHYPQSRDLPDLAKAIFWAIEIVNAASPESPMTEAESYGWAWQATRPLENEAAHLRQQVVDLVASAVREAWARRRFAEASK